VEDMPSRGRTEGDLESMVEDKKSEAESAQKAAEPMSEREIDRNLAGTFPASDPPSWTLGTDHQDHVRDEEKEENEDT
jgi:hypothetical protein